MEKESELPTALAGGWHWRTSTGAIGFLKVLGRCQAVQALLVRLICRQFRRRRYAGGGKQGQRGKQTGDKDFHRRDHSGRLGLVNGICMNAQGSSRATC